MAETVFSTDFSSGQSAIANHDNIRVPLDPSGAFDIQYLDGVTDPHLPNADPHTIYLAPESTLRSGDTGRFPFTERLPDSELDLYLAPDSPIVCHFFKRYGKQWWTLSKRLTLPPAAYTFSCEIYPDIYSGNHQFAPDPLSGEYRLVIGPKSEPIFTSSGEPFKSGNFGQWVPLSITANHPGGEFRHGLEFRARWGVETVGLFIRRWKVVRNTVTPEPTPTPTPSPQPGTVSAISESLNQLSVDFESMAQASSALLQQLRVDIANAREMVERLKREISS